MLCADEMLLFSFVPVFCLFFLKYHHTVLLIKKGGGQIEATIPCILKSTKKRNKLFEIVNTDKLGYCSMAERAIVECYWNKI
jgi:hypothetical protein